MGILRTGLLIASAAFLIMAGPACSGSNGVDLGKSGAGGDGDSGVTLPPGDDMGGGAHDGATSAVDADAGEDATLETDSAVPDDAADAAVPDAGAVDAAVPDANRVSDSGSDDGEAAAPVDSGHDDTFACGPTLRCDPATQYCNIAAALVTGPVTTLTILDAGSRYTCVDLPACDAASECLCIQGGGSGPILAVTTNIVPGSPTCSCSDSKGDITRTCKNGGIVPLAN